jgi:hypothetical protein
MVYYNLLRISCASIFLAFGFDLLFPKRDLDKRLLGLNAFANEPNFGRVEDQYKEAREVLGIKNFRVLFYWSEDMQPNILAPKFYGFYDDIVRSLPRSENIAVVTGLPLWSLNGDSEVIIARFLNDYLRPTVRRYRRSSKIKYWQIWNEPNNESFRENNVIGVTRAPLKYVDLLRRAKKIVRRLTRRGRVVMGATTSILQNFPETLEYNKALVANDIKEVTHSYAVHFYGENFQNFLLGVDDFLKDLQLPILVTEIGARGSNDHENYIRGMVPYLKSNYPRMGNFYLYQFTEFTPGNETFGLKHKGGVSTLYNYLRSN